MASEVEICNIALSYLGDTASVASIDPPEGSAQAEHCARFYPQARNTLLEMHQWGFCTQRVALAEVVCNWPEWLHAYVQPSNALNLIAVLPPDATDDYTQPIPNPATPTTPSWGYPYPPYPQGSVTAPQPYCAETDDQGRALIYTNQANAVLRYTAVVTDTTKFSPLFVEALTWKLAAMLAGPLIKGDAGAATAQRCLQQMAVWLSKAQLSDAGQRRITPTHVAPWLAGR